jgi:hypothetical protein
MKDHTDLKIALAILIPSFLAGAALVVVFANSADAINCDKANLGANDQGHIRGNSHCSTGVEPKEPARDCGHKNSEKDNDGDGATICIGRG